MKRKIIYSISILVLGFILALLFIPLLFEDEIKEMVRIELNKNIDAEVDFEDIKLSLLSSFPDFTISIKKLEIKGKNEFEGQSLFFAEDIKLNSSLHSVINRKEGIKINKLLIEDSDLNLLTDRNGKSNADILHKGAETSSSSEMILELEDVKIKNLAFNYMDSVSHLHLTISDFNNSGKVNVTGNTSYLQSSSDFSGLSVSQSNVPLLKSEKGKILLNAIVDSENQSYIIESSQIGLEELLVEMNGDITIKDAVPYLNVTAKSTNNKFESLYSVLPITESTSKVNAKGDFAFDVKAEGPINLAKNIIPLTVINLVVNNGVVQYEDFEYPIENINVNSTLISETHNLDDLILHVPLLEADVQDSKVSGSFTVSRINTNPTIKMKAKTRLDLGKWSKALPLSKISLVKGLINADVQMVTNQSDIQKKQYENISLEGTILGENISLLDSNENKLEINKLITTIDPQEARIVIDRIRYGETSGDCKIQVKKPLEIIFTNSSINGQLAVNADYINYNELVANGGKTENKGNPGLQSLFQRLKFKMLGDVGSLKYDIYDLKDVSVEANLLGNSLDISSLLLTIGESQFDVQGKLSKLYEYSFESDTMEGNIHVKSQIIKLDDFLNDDQKLANNTSKAVLLPLNQNIQISTDIDKVVFKSIEIWQPEAKLLLSPGKMDLLGVRGQTMKGEISLEGTYNTLDPSNPAFAIDLDLSKIDFESAILAMPVFSVLAPAGKFVQGFFNSSVNISGNLDEQLFPKLFTLTGNGLFETLDGKISGFVPLDKINQLFNIGGIKEWTLRNTKSWFEVEDGYVKMRDLVIEWQGISFLVSGKHQLGGDMDYRLIAHVPKELLRKDPILANIDQGIDKIAKEAESLGINLGSGDYLDMEILLKGKLNNPQLNWKPIGMSKGASVDKQIQSGLTSKAEAVKDSARQKIQEEKDTIITKLDKKKEAVVDSIKTKITNQLDSILKKSPQTDSLLQSKTIDSLRRKAADLLNLKNKSEIDSTLKDLKKWNPFSKSAKKKKKN